jgi:hypothetical protein
LIALDRWSGMLRATWRKMRSTKNVLALLLLGVLVTSTSLADASRLQQPAKSRGRKTAPTHLASANRAVESGNLGKTRHTDRRTIAIHSLLEDLAPRSPAGRLELVRSRGAKATRKHSRATRRAQAVMDGLIRSIAEIEELFGLPPGDRLLPILIFAGKSGDRRILGLNSNGELKIAKLHGDAAFSDPVDARSYDFSDERPGISLTADGIAGSLDYAPTRIEAAKRAGRLGGMLLRSEEPISTSDLRPAQ